LNGEIRSAERIDSSGSVVAECAASIRSTFSNTGNTLNIQRYLSQNGFTALSTI
jgi:hypothetical protein